MILNDQMTIIGEWRLTYRDRRGRFVKRTGWLKNHITAVGAADVASLIAGYDSPYLILGTDTAAGDVITEGERFPVDAVVRDGAVVRFRTVLGSLQGNTETDWQKAATAVKASSAAGTGVLLNILTAPISKTINTTLTIESRITVRNGGA